MAIVAGMSRCAKHGVLIKGGGMLEKLAQAKTLFFDKTGTLTGGRARLVGIEAAPELDTGELLRIAASLDQVSQHVIAQAIVNAARDRGLPLSMPSTCNLHCDAMGVILGRYRSWWSFVLMLIVAACEHPVSNRRGLACPYARFE